MKRMAAVLATMGALSAVVPAAAPAAETKSGTCHSVVLLLRFC